MLIKWNETTASDIEISEALVMLCTGSTEQHSNYLPLGTDSFIGESLGEAAAQKVPFPVLMLPPLRIGWSPHHRAFPGCLTLRQSTMFDYLIDVLTSAYDNGANKIMILNSHGGNQTCLQSVVNEIGSTSGKKVVLVNYWRLISDEINKLRETEQGGMGHAGEAETSMMLHFKPSLVNESRIDDRAPAVGNKWYHPELFASNSVYIYKPVNEVSQQGNIGQPQYGNKKKGGVIAEAVIRELVILMDYLYENEF